MTSNNVQFQQPLVLPQMTAPINSVAPVIGSSLPQCINTSSIMSYITQYWWVIVALILAFLYYRQSINKAKKGKENKIIQSSSI